MRDTHLVTRKVVVVVQPRDVAARPHSTDQRVNSKEQKEAKVAEIDLPKWSESQSGNGLSGADRQGKVGLEVLLTTSARSERDLAHRDRRSPQRLREIRTGQSVSKSGDGWKPLSSACQP
eukprot:1335905-Rhodomonas_salina.1